MKKKPGGRKRNLQRILVRQISLLIRFSIIWSRNVHLGLCSGDSTMMGLVPKVTNETLCTSFAYKNISIKCCSLWSNYIQRNSQPLLNFSKHKDSRILCCCSLHLGVASSRLWWISVGAYIKFHWWLITKLMNENGHNYQTKIPSYRTRIWTYQIFLPISYINKF